MIRVLMEAGQAKTGDEIQVAGLSYRISDVEHHASGVVKMIALRAGGVGGDLEASVVLRIDQEAQFEIVAPDQDGQS